MFCQQISIIARKVGRTGFTAALILAVSAGGALAQSTHGESKIRSFSLYEMANQGVGAARADRIHFDHSGTRGREGLGGSSAHPEGPGNVSD